MFTFVHTCMHVWARMYGQMNTCENMYTHIYIYICIPVFICVYIYTCYIIYVDAYVCIRVYACMSKLLWYVCFFAHAVFMHVYV